MEGGSSLGTEWRFYARLAALLGAMLMMMLTTALAADDHPASGQITCDPGPAYGTADFGFPLGYSKDDLTFGGPYPTARKLTPPERYMLAGTLGSLDGAGDRLPAWITTVEDFCLDYYSLYGVLPPSVTPDGLAALRGVSALSLTDQALVINPITGEAPRLDTAQFSPGDIYVRALSREEIRYFAGRNLALKDMWINGVYTDPATGSLGKVRLTSPVLYVRAYGVSGVIYENLAYRLSEPDYSAPVVVASVLPSLPSDDDWGWEETGCAPSG